MENESTFVAPEGVYTVTEEHKPSPLHTSAVYNVPIYPTRVSSIVVLFTAPKQGGTPGFAQLLGGNKENKKEKPQKPEKAENKEDGASVSSSDTADDGSDLPAPENAPSSPTIPTGAHTLFSHPPAPGKKKNVSRPKHNIRTTSSTFITRLQSAEGLTKTLQSKQGESTFLFYNLAKNFFWEEVGSKAKVRYECIKGSPNTHTTARNL
jgi:hypothetical protein